MVDVTIYTTYTCPYCNRAKELLNSKNIAYKDIDVTNNSELRGKMTELAGGRTSVPQIFIDGKHIGGCDDLVDLDEDGELDQLLS